MPFYNFEKYPNPVFVETGSYMGNGIALALLAGFPEIHSIEISTKYFNICKDRFQWNNTVHLYLGDSRNMLWSVIQSINQPITFWLDGHWSGDDTGYGNNKYPIFWELNQILSHPIKTHTILIDDVRLFETEWQYDKQDILDALLDINPNYQISYEDGYVEKDVLVARVA